jgi:hypothetical protein
MNSCNTSILTIFNYFETFKLISNRFLSIILYRKPHCFQRPTTAEPAALLSRIYRVHADESPTKPRVCGQLLPLAALSVVYRINNDVGSRLIRNVLLIALCILLLPRRLPKTTGREYIFTVLATGSYFLLIPSGVCLTLRL